MVVNYVWFEDAKEKIPTPGQFTCPCGGVVINVNQPACRNHLECCCNECEVRCRYGFSRVKGAKKVWKRVKEAAYYPNDLTVAKGIENLQGFTFTGGNSLLPGKRLLAYYCKACGAPMGGGEHPAYGDDQLGTDTAVTTVIYNKIVKETGMSPTWKDIPIKLRVFEYDMSAQEVKDNPRKKGVASHTKDLVVVDGEQQIMTDCFAFLAAPIKLPRIGKP